jgi:NADH dehydrogenase FAD-containing subunit
MSPGRLAARRRHAIRAIQGFQQQFLEMYVEIQDLSVSLDAHEDRAGDLLWTAGIKARDVAKELDKAISLLYGKLSDS